MLISQKFLVPRDRVFERVRILCNVDLTNVSSADELSRALDTLEEIRFKGVSSEPMTVFVVHHLRVLPGDVEGIKMIGVYSTERAAHAAIDRLRLQPGFEDHPRIVQSIAEPDVNGFHVGKYRLDEDHWAEGFATVR